MIGEWKHHWTNRDLAYKAPSHGRRAADHARPLGPISTGLLDPANM